jgi:hypothetical protein
MPKAEAHDQPARFGLSAATSQLQFLELHRVRRPQPQRFKTLESHQAGSRRTLALALRLLDALRERPATRRVVCTPGFEALAEALDALRHHVAATAFEIDHDDLARLDAA